MRATLAPAAVRRVRVLKTFRVAGTPTPKRCHSVTKSITPYPCAIAPIPGIRRVGFLWIIVLASLAPALPAQTAAPAAVPQVPPGVTLPPGVRLQGVVTNPPGVIRTNAARTISSEDQRLQELIKAQFDRRPASILLTLAAPGPTNDVQRFQRDVVTGKWKEVGAFLAKLPTNQVTQVYTYLLQQLQLTPRDNPQQATPEGYVQRPGMRSVESVLLPDDILALADAKPGELDDDQLDLLGKLLGKSLASGAYAEPFLARLETGTSRLGGQDPKHRENAVALLKAAGRWLDAGKFLPPLKESQEKKDIKSLDLHARYWHAVALQQPGAEALRQTWDLNQLLLGLTRSGKTADAALQRSLELMPILSRELVEGWLAETFKDRESQGRTLLSSMASMVTQGLSSRDATNRLKNLTLQRQMVDQMLGVAGSNVESWKPALNMLALGWLQEADYSKTRYVKRRPGSNQYGQDYDEFGNPTYYNYNPNEVPVIAPEQLLTTAPSREWQAALDASLWPRLQYTLGELHLKAEEDVKALQYVEALATGFPKAAQGLAHEFLKTWARVRSPMTTQPQPRYGPVWYGPGSPYGMRATSGIPLTRSQQVRNMRDLADSMSRLRRLQLPALDEKLVVAAFSSSHSPAEVYRIEDVESVLGAFDSLKPEAVAELLQAMRTRLAGQWRQPAMQQQAKTQRTDKEVEAEVRRGYEVITRLIQKGLETRPRDWRLSMIQGAALFDWAEYEYGKGADLAVYIERRDRAFQNMRRSAQLYVEQAPGLDEKEQSPAVFQQWFNATLGASDLAYLTRQTKPDTNHLEQIRATLFSLPPPLLDRHVATLGKALSDSITSLKPEMKPRYLRSGLQIVGAHESAAEARKLVAYYEDLLKEIALDVRVDGETTVGHDKPFGLFIGIRHTADLGRESGGFAKYLQNQQSNPYYYYNPYGSAPTNYRDEFEKRTRETLAKGFEVLSVTFSDEKVQPRGIGQANWRETPIAYALLKARDAAVDRIPSLALDLDFFDSKGQVTMPVESQVMLIDARPDSPPLRTSSELEATQILDERDLKKDKMTLEIKVSGKGLVPDLKDLFDVAFSTFKIEKVNDQGVAVTKFNTEGSNLGPLSERTWLLDLRVADGAPENLRFSFPKSRQPDLKVTYKRYADADLAEVKSDIALAGVPLKPANPWKTAGAVVGLILIIAAAIVITRRGAKKPVEAAAAYALPSQVTPFTVLNLLRKMNDDHALNLPADRRRDLAQTIASLEKKYFGPGAETNHETELEQIARQWVASAR
jgi:hypothetical protein